MILVNYYGNGVVRFSCTKCGFFGEYSIYDRLTDNCVLDIDVCCGECGEKRVLYILKCKDIIYANELLSELKSLKIKRFMEESTNGNKKIK